MPAVITTDSLWHCSDIKAKVNIVMRTITNGAISLDLFTLWPDLGCETVSDV